MTCDRGKVIAYDAKGAWGAMEGMGRAACGIVGCVGKAIGGTLDAIIRAFE